MKLLKFTAFFLTITLISNCAFLPSAVMRTRKVKKSIEKFKGDFDVPPPPDFYEEDSTYTDEAPAQETFNFGAVECMEASLYLDKMNIVYVGVDNPSRIFVTNVPNRHIEVESDNENLEIIEQEGGFYIFRATQPGRAKVTVKAGYYEEYYDFQMKYIPNPVAKLGNKNSGEIAAGELNAQGGISAWLENFDFDSYCVIKRYTMTRIAKNGSQETVENEGAKFEETTTNLLKVSETGDVYLFENIESKCPGDEENRKINSLIFRVL